jgi:hypothetical protein
VQLSYLFRHDSRFAKSGSVVIAGLKKIGRDSKVVERLPASRYDSSNV